ncbi:hypothetical protein Cpir12675_001978 [Ceratocystis pirilliformis]|uniref:DNA replication licensing factor mcm10 n=1 Tax=Ceratocystis pirilliformis TaxID=259994 RepID=A0ABR3ZDK1_9PEZI
MIPSQRDEPQWPPRSPRDALLLTPRGREKYKAMTAEQQRQLQMSPSSPSPLRRARIAHTPEPFEQALGGLDGDDDDDEDEDEETLQLKLQAIQARLKLKKLQKEKKLQASQSRQPSQTSPGTPVKPKPMGLLDSPAMFANLPKSPASVGKSSARLAYTRPSASANASSSVSSSVSAIPDPMALKPPILPPPRATVATPVAEREVEVPLSPVQRVHKLVEATSPLRKILSRGLRGEDVRLDKPGKPKLNDSFSSKESGGVSTSTGYLRTARGTAQHKQQAGLAPVEDRPLSFNERLALAKAEHSEKLERQERIQQVRSNTFGITQQEMQTFKEKAVEIVQEPKAPHHYTREEIMGTTKPEVEKKSEASFESYSSFHLTNRILPHQVVARHMQDSKIFSVTDLTKVVKAPDFELPEIEQNIVVFAILARKSDPRTHKPNAAQPNKKQESKYMVMTLVDLNLDVELFLFGTGFERFWKLTEGTVLAILNPNVMPPPPGKKDTGRWSLVINSDADTILEIGTARDLGYCKSVKKDGHPCGAWINSKRTEYCEFHSNQALQKIKQGRVEMTGSGFGRSGKDWNGMTAVTNKKFGKGGAGYAIRKNGGMSSELNRGKGHYDFDSQSNFFMSRTRSAADMMDGKHLTMAEKQEREDNLRRALIAKEKERDLARKLAGRGGSGVGHEYMAKFAGKPVNLAKPSISADSGGSGSFTPVSAGTSTSTPISSSHSTPTLTLAGISRGRRAEDVDLTSGKRKRVDDRTISADKPTPSATGGSGPSYGWGSGLSSKLGRMKGGERLCRQNIQPSTADEPDRKKTRFVTEDGVKEAGRESAQGMRSLASAPGMEMDLGDVDFVLEIEGAPPGFNLG